MKTIVIFAMAFILTEAKKTDPGFVGRITMKGLQYGWNVWLQELQKQRGSIRIPDVEGSVSVALLGRIHYYADELQFKSLDLSHSGPTFYPDTGIKVSIHQGQIQVVGKLRIKTALFSGSSRLELWLRGSSATVSLGITCDDLGHGAVWDAGCISDVGQVDLSFYGGSGWIFNLFKGAVVGPVRSAISPEICPLFKKIVTQIEEKLSSLPVSLPVDSMVDVDIGLVGHPLITSKSADLLVKAEFVAQSQHLLPYQPEKLVLPDVDSHMLLLALSQFSFNSAGFVHYKAGFLKSNITDDMIPKQSPMRLNIRSLGFFVPELPTRFPDSPPLLLQVSARSAPTVSCQPDSLTAQASANIEIYAMYPNQTLSSLFQMQADCLIDVNLVLSEGTVGTTISVKNFSLSLVHSNVGTVKMDTMQKTLNLALKIALPFLNDHLKNVFPLPTSMFRLQNPRLRVMQGCVLIMTDLQADMWRFLDFSNLFGKKKIG
ncbi:bactericidal permeability-increasing protein-like [Mantella aurantiaca]